MPKLTSAQVAKIRNSVVDPVKFAEEMLDTRIWGMQANILRSINTPYSRTSVKACHSSSKTFTAALATLWWLARWEKGTVVTTAPTWGQVERLLWGEVHSALQRSRYPFPKPTKTELRIGPKRYAVGLSTNVTNQDEGVRFQGFHNDHVLMVFDEAPGVDPKIWQAAEGVRAGGDVRFLCQGNPTFSGGPFGDSFRGKGDWTPFTISAFNTPNFEGVYLKYQDGEENEVIHGDPKGRDLLTLGPSDLNDNPLPYLITKRWVREKFYEWGPGSALFESRVLGEFPSQSEDALISMFWLLKARERSIDAEGKAWAGIDVAGPGEDETVLTIRRGPKILLMKAWVVPDPRGELLAALSPYRDSLAGINVDSAGIGWGMYQHIKDQAAYKNIVHPVNVGESPKDGDKYSNLKSELYWNLRGRFHAGEICGFPEGEEGDTLLNQLASIRYKHNEQGKVQIESKADARKRGVHSPDRAESLMLAFAEANQYMYGVLDLMRAMRSGEGSATVGQDTTPEGHEYRQEQEAMRKIGTSKLIKPVTAPQTLRCPVETCGSVAVVKIAGMYRCNQCGHSWQPGSTVLSKPVTRADYLAKA